MRKVTLTLSIISIMCSILLLVCFLLDAKTSPSKVYQKFLSSIDEVKASTDDIKITYINTSN